MFAMELVIVVGLVFVVLALIVMFTSTSGCAVRFCTTMTGAEDVSTLTNVAS